MKRIALYLMLAAGLCAQAYEYNVSEPSIKPQCKGAEQGVWTLDWNAALDRAKSEGRYTLVLFTGSWWCPYCHTIEDLVLTSDAWREYVKENGFYLAELDYSYRYAVPAGQEWKSYYPDATEGWGFKCWYMNPAYLAENGMSAEDGLKAIQDEYVYQGQMALPDAAMFTMKTWDGASEMTYGRIAYACIVVIDPDGNEVGRVDFPWHSKASVTASEAQEFEIQSIEKIINGECSLCGEQATGLPDTSVAQTYCGWLTDASGGNVGSAEFKLGKRNGRGVSKVSGFVTVKGRKTRFKSVSASSFANAVEFAGGTASAAVRFGETSFEGFVKGDFGIFSINGGRDVFKARDQKSIARRAQAPVGSWSLVVKSSNSSVSPFARGYGALSATLKATGRATVKGTLGDGTKMSVQSRTLVGDNGMCCVPVRADLYSKKGGVGFVMWFKNGRLFSVTDESDWIAAGKNGAFRTSVTTLNTTAPGTGVVEGEMDFQLSGFDEGGTIKGMKAVVDPTLDIVTVSGRKWAGTSDTLFKATANATTGLLTGSMTFFVGSEARPRKFKGTFSGVVMGGSGYGSVVVKGEGSWAAKITACGSCVD